MTICDAMGHDLIAGWCPDCRQGDRLPQIKLWREQWDRTAHTDGVVERLCAVQVDWLIAEVERLREENESLRAISGRAGIG